MLYFTGTFHLGTKLIWTLFLLVNSNLHSPASDYLFIVLKLKLGDGLDQMHFSELSETQNYAYWDANFCLGTHKFYNAGVLHAHIYFRHMSKFSSWRTNTPRGRSKTFDSTSPRLSSRIEVWPVVCLRRPIILFKWCVICSLGKCERWLTGLLMCGQHD